MGITMPPTISGVARATGVVLVPESGAVESCRERLTAFAERLLSRGIDAASVVALPALVPKAWTTVVHQTAEVAPTAVFACNDWLDLDVLRSVRTPGLSVSEAVGIVGFDDTPLAALAAPPFSSVAQSLRDMGRLAVSVLLFGSGQVSGSGQGGPTLQFGEEWRFPPELVVRASSARTRGSLRRTSGAGGGHRRGEAIANEGR
ncbi:MAG: Transcriptional regulator, LacI family [Hydrogenibacillus schlegelii]|uniref:Transcriptional regulator, LacI family n=2 Tax=Hydrogenibacillus schlegelii TaxID=1484 RepID=A0A2T5G498_HYDSH|nr:MAG: Transcriptional regulator, LacI family [Hydrogenibacillus schlegelii]